MILFNQYFEERFERVRNSNQYTKFGNVQKSGTDDIEYNPELWKSNNDKKTKEFIPDNHELGIRQNISNEIKTRLNTIFRSYGFDLGGQELNKLPSDGSMVYRGHKSPNPSSKGYDAKAKGSTVYWSLNPKYAFNVYAKSYNSMSDQIGQSGASSLQHALHPDNPNLTDFSVGYFSIATPKNPNTIKWYSNFGYEDNESPSSINDVLNWSENQKYSAECVEENTSFKKIRTYLVDQYGRAISFNRLQQISPRIFDRVINSTVSKKSDGRVY